MFVLFMGKLYFMGLKSRFLQTILLILIIILPDAQNVVKLVLLTGGGTRTANVSV